MLEILILCICLVLFLLLQFKLACQFTFYRLDKELQRERIYEDRLQANRIPGRTASNK